jgi:putative glutamine amidotransferase
MKPRIAITANCSGEVPTAYVEAIDKAGGMPVVLDPLLDETQWQERLSSSNGLLLTGGADLDPKIWGKPRHPKTNPMDFRRQKADMAAIAIADNRQIPVLGICLGCQEMAKAMGGCVKQHLDDTTNSPVRHGGGDRPPAEHAVHIEPDSRLAAIVGIVSLKVNSTHHQAVREAGRGLRVVARSADGVIEAIEDPTPGRFFLGVQWHPEKLPDEPPHRALFEALVRASQPAG